MKLLRRTLLLTAAAGLSLSMVASPALASAEPVSKQHGRVTPADRADGLTGRQLLTQAWVNFYETPTTAPPVDCFYLGQTGKVLLAGRISPICPVKLGFPVMYFFGSTCDSVSPPPFFAITAKAQRRCALAADHAFITSIRLQVDDGPRVKITTPCFELFTRQQTVQLPADNIAGGPAGPATFVAHAWAAFADHLSLGVHTTTFSIAFTDGTHDSITRTIRVVP